MLTVAAWGLGLFPLWRTARLVLESRHTRHCWATTGAHGIPHHPELPETRWEQVPLWCFSEQGGCTPRRAFSRSGERQKRSLSVQKGPVLADCRTSFSLKGEGVDAHSWYYCH